MSGKTESPAVVGDAEFRTVSQVSSWRRWLSGGATWVLLLDLLLIVVFGLLSTNQVFWSLRNVQNLLLNGAEGLLLALAMSLLLAAGLIDLSLGVNLAFSSVIGAVVMVTASGGQPAILGAAGASQGFTNVPFGIAAGLVACLLSGMAFGLVNGLIIARLRVNSLIATLGTMSVGTGVVLLITRGSDIAGLPPELQSGFGLFKVFDVIPLPAVVAVGVAVALWAVVRYLRFGMHTLAIGSSRVAAERAGIRVDRHVIKLAMLAGALAGLAGFINLSHFGSTTVNGHVNDPLAAITAAVIGGAALTGGRINIVGTVWGAALALILLGGLVVIGTSAFYQLVVIGAILIVAVAVDQFRTRRREER